MFGDVADVAAVLTPGVGAVAGSSIAGAGLLGLYAAFAPLPEPVVAGRLWGICLALLVIARHHGNIRAWVHRRLV